MIGALLPFSAGIECLNCHLWRILPFMVKVSAEALALLEGFADPAILVSPDYRVLAANQRYRQRYGDLVSSTAQRCHRLSHERDLPCDQAGEPCPLAEAMRSREPVRALHIHHTAHGDEHVDVETRPVLDANGEVCYCLEILRAGQVVSMGAHASALVGRAPGFNRMLEMVHRVAPSDAAVLLLGETGTGKELVARAIHAQSGYSDGAFVPLECSGLTEALFESELFGHEKGAFTGAHNRKAGLIEYARGGTLFLDEVGDIPLHLQVKLLRLLETRSFRRVGGTDPIAAEFRLICATHRDLKTLVASGAFREDLFYRISSFPILLPPLRERREDLPLLVDALLRRIPSAQNMRLDARAMQCLRGYHFPGNIRELRNILERGSLLADGEWIRARHLADLCRDDLPREPPSLCAGDQIVPLADVERIYLRQVVTRHPGDRASLAAQLGISERTLFRKLREIA
jgi:two-component system, NtrC family, response regulator HydG